MGRERIQRYIRQSSRYRTSALRETRNGHWPRVEELLWGSLVGAGKAVALSRGVELKSDEEVKRFVTALAKETGDRRLAEAFNQLSNFSTTLYRIQDSQMGPKRLYQLVERVSHSVEKLWASLNPEEGAKREEQS